MENLLYELIKFKTVSSMQEFEKCFNYIKDYLKDSNLIIKEYIFNNTKSMVIANVDTLNYDIVFCGHLDVVPAEDVAFQPKVVNKRLYGRGAFDMKGHDAVMIEIMKKLNTKKKIALFLTSDEEQGGFNGTNKLLNEIGYTCKLAIVPDAGNNFDLIKEEKGVLQLELAIKGKACHASKLWDGENAIIKLIDIYNKLLKIYPLPKSENDFKTSINLGYIKGGDVINKVPYYATVGLDIRHIYEDKKEDIINNIIKINKDIEITTLKEGKEFYYLENELSKKYLKVAEKILKRKIEYKKCESSSDARFFYEKKIPCILMNAKGYDMHGDNEYVEIDSLYTLYQIYEEFIKTC